MLTQTARRKAAALLALVLFSALLPAVSLAATYTGTINADKVFLRAKANTSSDYYDKLMKGTKVGVTDASGDFYKVRYRAYTGYVMKKFVDLSSSDQRKLKASAEPVSTSKYAKTKYISGLGDAPRETRNGSAGEDVGKLQRAVQIKTH